MDVPGFLKAIYLMAETTVAQKQYLTELDSAIGDADHGINMERGFSKAAAKLQSGSYSDLGDLSKDVAMVLMQSVGGASGPIYGTLFMRMSMKFKDQPTADLVLAISARGSLAIKPWWMPLLPLRRRCMKRWSGERTWR